LIEKRVPWWWKVAEMRRPVPEPDPDAAVASMPIEDRAPA
jgi:hypothetical protein